MKVLLLLLAACTSPSPRPVPPAARPTATATATAPAPACATPEHRQFDFWIGDWDVRVRARAAPDKDAWGEGKGTQHVESVLGGCSIAEQFTADGPQQPWSGRSYSMWQPSSGKWRQTWVDDSGNYLAFSGGLEQGRMTLYGEPRDVNGKSIQMRMVFGEVTARSLQWEWQRSEDSWATHIVMMTIDYQRR